MTTKAQRQAVAALADAKGRRRAGLFATEGTKCVLDTIDSFELDRLFATQAWLENHNLPQKALELSVACNRGELGEMSSLTLAPDVIAVYRMPQAAVFTPEMCRGRLIVALDRVQDPGNLGTIIRTADWMGIDTIIASTDTVDCFNPKTIQATMGAISRVRVIYGDLAAMLSDCPTEVFGTFLDGDNIYTAPLPSEAVVVMGNEGRGISPEVASKVNRRILIPSYPPERITSESLNVATATAITLSQFIARNFTKNG